MPHTPTDEQLDIIRHDTGSHATVLAVAGSGKTSTMIYRIQHLLRSGVSEKGIRAVMYNSSARGDFEKKLQEAGVVGIKVQTFHAMGNSILTWARENRCFPSFRLLDEDREVRDLAIAAIRAANEAMGSENILDPDDLIGAVSNWKAMMTPPEEAQHLRNPFIELAYRHFERLRKTGSLITFDDQIYEAVRLLERQSVVADAVTNRLEHLIIDEFQDVNFARLQLARIIAGKRARVMVIGDDDQCIYEWQGARSSYIKRGFETEFTHFPHTRYRLTRSFRYGPLIAQVAANVIQHNTDRDKKDLIANDLLLANFVTVDTAAAGGGNRQLLPRLQKLLDEGVAPKDIAILVRKYSQSYLAQGLLLSRGIPFFVDGESPLGNAYPVKVAIRYLEAALALDCRLDDEGRKTLEYVVQRPPRYVKKEDFHRVAETAAVEGQTEAELLRDYERLFEAGIGDRACHNLQDLERNLRGAVNEAGKELMAGKVLDHLLNVIDFRRLFESFESTASVEDDLGMMRALAALLSEAEVPLACAKKYVESMNPRQGRPDSECIRFTTVFKAKGLEWDHVFLPDLIEGQCPDSRSEVNVCVNRIHPARAADATQALESERRLFYVAVTRARKTLHFFADPSDMRMLSRFVYEAAADNTRDAVTALQHLLRDSGDAEKHRNILAEAAKRYAHLQDGLLAMLRRAVEDSPEIKREEIDKAVATINRLRPAPFAYPHAYPSSSESDIRNRWDPSLGLPF